MTTRKHPEALDSAALDGVTGGTGHRTLVGDSGWQPGNDQPGGDVFNDSLSGGTEGELGGGGQEDGPMPGIFGMVNPGAIPGLSANTPILQTGTREVADRVDEDGNALPLQGG